MKINKSTLILTTALLFSHTACASIKSSINAILAKSPQPIHTGILIENIKTRKILYSKDANYLYAPASVQKLLTATAALIQLGADFTYKTTLLTNGSIGKNHALNGDLIVKFSGDPQLSSDDLQQLLDSLQAKGIKKINGRIKLDISTYNDIPYPPGWLWDDLSYSYAAPLTTAIIDKNKFILRLTPAKTLGAPPSLSIDIPNHLIHFNNSVKTTAHHNKLCPLTIYSDLQNNFTLKGCLNKDWGRQRRNLALRNPIPYVKIIIRQALANDAIYYKGPISIGRASRSDVVLSVHRSEPLRKLLKHMLKKSDNLITDSLLKQVGYSYYHRPGNWHNGIQALKKILKPTGINFRHNLIDDGAGLSRYDLLTPHQLVLLLNYIYAKPKLRHILVEALPIGGIDGTLVERMFSMAKYKRVRAKTGSMTGITSLSGYIYTRHLGVLSFSMIINGFVGKAHAFRRLEDQICEFLANYHGNSHEQIRSHRQSRTT